MLIRGQLNDSLRQLGSTETVLDESGRKEEGDLQRLSQIQEGPKGMNVYQNVRLTEWQ